MAKAIFYAWFFSAILPIGLLIIGVRFIPSVDWISVTRFPALAMSVAAAICTSWRVATWPPYVQNFSTIKRAVSILVVAALSFVMAPLPVTLGAPMLATAVGGSFGHVTYVVEDVRNGNYRHCRDPISVEGVGSVVGSICNLPDSILATLTPGDRINVYGRATTYGVFARKVLRLAD